MKESLAQYIPSMWPVMAPAKITQLVLAFFQHFTLSAKAEWGFQYCRIFTALLYYVININIMVINIIIPYLVPKQWLVCISLYTVSTLRPCVPPTLPRLTFTASSEAYIYKPEVLWALSSTPAGSEKKACISSAGLPTKNRSTKCKKPWLSGNSSFGVRCA